MRTRPVATRLYFSFDVLFQNIEHGTPLPCKYCSDKLQDEEARIAHVRLKHPYRRKPPIPGFCEICEETLTNIARHRVIIITCSNAYKTDNSIKLQRKR